MRLLWNEHRLSRSAAATVGYEEALDLPDPGDGGPHLTRSAVRSAEP